MALEIRILVGVSLEISGSSSLDWIKSQLISFNNLGDLTIFKRSGGLLNSTRFTLALDTSSTHSPKGSGFSLSHSIIGSDSAVGAMV